MKDLKSKYLGLTEENEAEAFSKQLKQVYVGQKVNKSLEELVLLGKFLIFLQCRPQLVSELQDAIGAFEMSVMPRSLCAMDGSLSAHADKATLMHGIEKVRPPSDDSFP